MLLGCPFLQTKPGLSSAGKKSTVLNNSGEDIRKDHCEFSFILSAKGLLRFLEHRAKETHSLVTALRHVSPEMDG